ncbi:MAG: HAD family hydrolase [Desulforhopalus sp.]
MMSHLSIIFDLDGTLLDTLSGLAETSNAMLARMSFPQHHPDAYKHYVGDGLAMLIERCCPAGTDEQTLERCRALFLEIYGRSWKTSCMPYQGVDELLSTLNKRRIPLAVLSNKPHDFTKLFVEEFFPGNIFASVYGQRQGYAKKPDPSDALMIAAELGSCADSTLFVGDTPVDIQTGRNGGMLTAGVCWGFRSVQELAKENPDILINHPMELIDYVTSLS